MQHNATAATAATATLSLLGIYAGNVRHQFIKAYCLNDSFYIGDYAPTDIEQDFAAKLAMGFHCHTDNNGIDSWYVAPIGWIQDYHNEGGTWAYIH